MSVVPQEPTAEAIWGRVIDRARGEFADAFAVHKRFFTAFNKLHSQQREAQARNRQAMFEAAEARQEAARLIETAKAQITQEVRRARGELRAELGTLAVQIAERLIRKSLRDDDHRRIVQEALARIEPA